MQLVLLAFHKLVRLTMPMSPFFMDNIVFGIILTLRPEWMSQGFITLYIAKKKLTACIYLNNQVKLCVIFVLFNSSLFL